MNKAILQKAYDTLEARNYERICLIAGICPECGMPVKRTVQNTEKSPVIEWKYICSSCEHTVEERILTQNLAEEGFISIIRGAA